MDIENMKNIVILKNLPSNMVEEAFVVLKDNIKIPKEEVVKNNKNINNDKEEKVRDNEYIIKEAEMIVSQYVSKLEESECNENSETNKIKEKYNKLKYVSAILFIVFCIIVVLVNLLK